jgi:hypothetical protein
MAIGLKKWIENNPVATLVSVIVSAAALSSGGKEYLVKQIESADLTQEKVIFLEQKTNLENSYNEKIATINTDKTKLSQQYEHDIQDLTERLISIKRGVGEQQSYMNIQVLQIPAVEIRALPLEYKGYDDNNFFINEPKSSPWAYRLTTEGEAIKSGPFSSLATQVEQAMGDKSKDLFGSPAHLWTGDPVADITFSFSGEQLSSTILPNIDVDLNLHNVKIDKSYGSDCAVTDDGEIHFNREWFFISYGSDVTSYERNCRLVGVEATPSIG